MKIMIAITTLSIGGAQTLILRLVEDLAKHNDVYLYSFNLFDSEQDTSVIERVSQSVNLVSAEKYKWIIKKLISLDFYLAKLGWDSNFSEKFRCYLFRDAVLQHKIDVVNTHLFHSDYLVSKSLSSVAVPIVMVDHGDYRFVLKDGIATESMISSVFQRADAIVYISESNLTVLQENKTRSSTIFRKIYNGFPEPTTRLSGDEPRAKLGIRRDALVFGMVARGIPEKGWHETIRAFQDISPNLRKATHLVLVGGSQYLQDLEATLTKEQLDNIHFTGYTDEPEYWIRACDVCLLPTHFAGESLPNSIVEYLSLGKPVIATSIGGISEMLNHQGEQAGMLINLDETGHADIACLTEAISTYMNDADLLNRHSELAILAFEKFKIEHCIQKYKELFAEVTQAL